jgi:hypothetical protein
MEASSINDWRNIQEVVRNSFAAMQTLLTEHADKIRTLERRQKDGASWTQVESSLAARATIQDVNQSLAGLAGVLSEKATAADVSAACSELATRSELNETNAVLTRRLQMCEQECSELRAELTGLRDLVSEKMDRSQLEQYPTKADMAASTCSIDDFQRLAELSVSREEVEQLVSNLATRDEVQAALQTRAGVAEVERALAGKTDVDRVMTALGERPSRIEVSDIVSSRLVELRTQLAASAATSSMLGVAPSAAAASAAAAAAAAAADSSTSFVGSTAGMRDIIALLDQKANARDVELLLASKLNRSELNEAMVTKVTRGEMESRMHSNAEAIANEVQAALLQSQKEVVAVLNKKAYKADVHRSLKSKADAKETQESLSRKPDAMEIRDALSQKVDKVACQRTISLKADVTQLKNVESQLRQLASEVNKSSGGSAEELHRLRREVMSAVNAKADGRHVAALVDQKVSVVDMNEALSRMSKAISANALEASTSVGEEEMSRLSGEVATLHQRMSTELLCARWIWKSGSLAGAPSVGVSHPGELVPWNVECSNSNPSVFRWSADSSNVGADLPGLYEIRVGMFTEKQPRVAVLVNGHVVFSTPPLDHYGSGGTAR